MLIRSVRHMNSIFKKFLAGIAAMLASFGFCDVASGLRTDRLVNPSNTGARPVFSWKMLSDRHGARQTAYRIRVGELWDSGIVRTAESLAVRYAGAPLTELTTYRWQVQICNELGEWSENSHAEFTTGFLDPEFWSGSEWISPAGGETSTPASFRKTLVSAKEIKAAFICASGLGVFEVAVNGARVSSDVLTPGFTEAAVCRHAFTYDVTALLKRAAWETNEISSVVSAGWWCDELRGRKGANKGQNRFFPTRPGFRAQLVLRHADGTETRVGTGTDWEATYSGPLMRAGIWEGESYDARLSATGWRRAAVNREFTGEIRNFVGPAVVHREDLAMMPRDACVLGSAVGGADGCFGDAVCLRRPGAGEMFRLAPGETLVLDFGQNAAAVPDFSVCGAAGTKLVFRFGEMLNEAGGVKSRGNDGPGGTLYRANLRGISASLEYVLRDGEQSYRPKHTFFGYRFASVETTGPVTVRAICSVPVSSVHAEDEVGAVETSDPLVNRLIRNVRWSHLSNYLSIPADCPQRDERLGWTGDAQVFAAAATRGAETYGFLRKWLADLRDGQMTNGAYCCVAPDGRNRHVGAMAGWSDAGVMVPYVLWKRYGDISVLEDGWASMTRYMDHLDRCGGPDRFNFGDWLAYELRTPGRDVHNQPIAYKRCLSLFYWIWDARLMSEMAEALGRAEDAARYRSMERRARKEYDRGFRGGNDIISEEFLGQTSALFLLRLDLCEEKWARSWLRQYLSENIAAHGNCLQTGFLGTSILLDTLSEKADLADVAWTLLLQRRNPSWLYSVDQGATTIWERWDSYTRADGFGPVAMNSFNHYANGSVLEWIYSAAAGIRPDRKSSGYRHFILKPRPDRRMQSVRARFDSPVGVIESEWAYEGAAWRWRFVIPANSSATVVVPRGMPREYPAGRYEIVAPADTSLRFCKMPFNNPEARPFLKVGLWVWPMALDYDGDGDLDIVASCPGGPSNGLYFFENPSDGLTKMPVFRGGVRIGAGRSGASLAAPKGPHAGLVTVPGGFFPDFLRSGFRHEVRFDGLPRNVHSNAVRGNVWRMADLDGDGRDDLLVGVGDWRPYGWADAWNEKGEWVNGDVLGLVYHIRNLGGGGASARWGRPEVLRHADGTPLLSSGSPIPMAADWDGDGDVDLLCAEFVDGFFFFENAGSAKSPAWAPRRTVRDSSGSPLKMELAMITPSAVDWDGDGDLDVVCGDEDGRVAYIENVGRESDGTPFFAPPRYFRQEAGDLCCGVLSTPWCFDMDDDGDLDIVSGDSAGHLNFIENLSGPCVAFPRWAEPVRLKAGGREVCIQAGANGSIQGPIERKWGYTTLSVADWDGDGLGDMVVNSITGDVVWYRNIGTRSRPEFAAAEDVEVEWSGDQPELAWGWYKPKHKKHPKGLLTQWRTTPVAIDWDNDGLVDLAMLDHEGYLALFRRAERDGRRVLLPPERVFADEDGRPLQLARLRGNAGWTGRRKLSFMDWDGDGRLDLFVNSKNASCYLQCGRKDGKWLFKNTGDVSDVSLQGHSTSPCPADFDGDGVPDLLIGAEDGFFYLVPNPRTCEKEVQL